MAGGLQKQKVLKIMVSFENICGCNLGATEKSRDQPD